MLFSVGDLPLCDGLAHGVPSLILHRAKRNQLFANFRCTRERPPKPDTKSVEARARVNLTVKRDECGELAQASRHVCRWPSVNQRRNRPRERTYGRVLSTSSSRVPTAFEAVNIGQRLITRTSSLHHVFLRQFTPSYFSILALSSHLLSSPLLFAHKMAPGHSVQRSGQLCSLGNRSR